MGILIRSAIVIGAIVYLAPLRYDSPTTQPLSIKPESLPLSGTTGAVWQALPEAAKKTVIDEAQKHLLEAARSEMIPESGRSPSPQNVSRPSAMPEKSKSGKTAKKE